MPATAAIPNDSQLAQWQNVELFSWGEAAWRWGNDCANKANLRVYYDACVEGDIPSCTFVNQQLIAEKPPE